MASRSGHTFPGNLSQVLATLDLMKATLPMIFRLRNRLLSATSLAFIALAISGCGRTTGPQLGQVEGVITIDGQPAGQAMIEFQPEQKNCSPSYGFADAAGRYKLQFTGSRKGAILGTHTVRITFDDDPSPDQPPPPISIPAKYNKRSELKAEVSQGSNRHNFDLRLQSEMSQVSRQKN